MRDAGCVTLVGRQTHCRKDVSSPLGRDWPQRLALEALLEIVRVHLITS